MLQSSWRWRRRQRRRRLLVCFVIKSWTCSWSLLRVQLSLSLLLLLLFSYTAHQSKLSDAFGFSASDLDAWLLSLILAGLPALCQSSFSLPPTLLRCLPSSPPCFAVRAKHQRTRYNGYVCFSPSLSPFLPVCVCVHVNFHLPDCGGVSICPICAILSVRPPVRLLKSSITTRSAHNLEWKFSIKLNCIKSEGFNLSL